MDKFNRVTFIGILTILLWVSHIPYLYPPPFPHHEGSRRLAKEIAETPESVKEKAGLGDYSQLDIEKRLDRGVKKVWLQYLITLTIGIIAGVLILKRRNIGRILAIGLYSIMLYLRAYSLLKRSNQLESLRYWYFVLIKEHPFLVIHQDIITKVVLIMTIIYLLRPSVAREFEVIPKSLD